ncbi:MAG: hypothetical protein JJ891_02460 [Rhizobiaceae bacterium]|jgi:hypothetical protein|nr:hypothetical protein [Rhizobiaceae bacterium]
MEQALVFTLAISVGLCYLIGRFLPNLYLVLAAVVILQVGGFVWVVETGGVFNSYSLVNCAIIATVTFLWFLVAAQFHLWTHSKDPAAGMKKDKGLDNG